MVTVVPKKKTPTKPKFPQPKAEFAGELAPGPVSQSHDDRMTGRKNPKQ